MKAVTRVCLCAVLTMASVSAARAQEPKSAALAKELVAALDAAQLDSIAAKDPSKPDAFVGALYIKGFQLLVVSAQYSAPLILAETVAQKNYRDVYIDLNSASVPGSKVFVEDMGADGLKATHAASTQFDAYEAGGKRTAFDGDWKTKQISEQDYMQVFSTADEQYSQMLTMLLAEVRK